MWKCPKCNKENEGNFCVLCGEPKPGVNMAQTGNNQQVKQYGSMQNSGSQSSMNQNNTYRKNDIENVAKNVKRKSNTGLIVLCISLGVLLIVAIVVVALLLLNNSNASDGKGNEIVYATTEPTYEATEEPGEIVIELDPYSSSSYIAFTDFNYNFVCPYPANFHEISSDGINALKTFESPDGTAKMTIRACENTSGIDIETAMNDFYNVYGGYVTYDATGETWYASSIDLGDRLLYRKCFITNGNIYCFDFEFIEYDVDYYSPYIEYIENNFKVL